MDCGIDGLNHVRVWADFLPASEQPQGENESLDNDKNPIPRMQADWREIDPDSPRVAALIGKWRHARGLRSDALDPADHRRHAEDSRPRPIRRGAAELQAHGAFVALAQQKGVFLLAGTDDGSLFDELDAYDSVGVPNAAILQAATVNGAKWLGKDAEFGTLAVGRRADLIIVDGDPLKTIGDIRKIDIVVKDGRIVFRK